ncbi:uridine kinase [Halorubellus sp. PRR65]|uniref:uridine kinase n=1 Tax=Halorubellus sp. PRR65 TaxID=3098148 RepID=UPI002B26287E|nr:uridine kinase [Halorubellus sp. PRR65]
MTIPSFVIGIAGGTGAGKTTVAREVADSVGEAVTRIPIDNYYHDLSHLEMDEREDVNYDHPDAFEWDLLMEHLDALLMGQPIEMPQYDFTIHNRKDETVHVEPSDVIVVEGIFALYDDAVTDRCDLKVYVETDADVRILRRIRRDVIDRDRDLEGVIDQYLGTVKPMHEQFVAPTKKHADIIIPEGANQTAVNLLTEKVEVERSGVAQGLASEWERNPVEVADTDGDRTTVTPSPDEDAEE